MTTTRHEATTTLCNYLATELDDTLVREDFSRAENSLQYSRTVDAGHQFLIVHFDFNPSSDPKAIALLLPLVRFVYPELNQRVLDMMLDMKTLSNANGWTINEQIVNAAPRDVRAGTWWFIYDHDSALKILATIREFIEQWTIPFLNKYTTVAALVDGFEQQDKCLPHDRRFWLFIIAAYTLLDQPAKAMQLLERKFGRPGAKREYARAFEYVDKMLKDARSV
jgi:hypothetical protein